MFEALVKKDKFTQRLGKSCSRYQNLALSNLREEATGPWLVGVVKQNFQISKFPNLEFPQMVDIESRSVLRKRENIKLEKNLTLEEGEIMSLQQMPTAHHTLCGMRSCVKNKARRDYDCTTA